MINRMHFPITRGKSIFFLLLVIFVFSRLLLLLYPSPIIYDPDELKIGSAAKEILQGGRFDLFDLQPIAHSGGSLLASCITAVFFKMFGVSFISLKLTGLFFSFLSFIILFFLLKEHFGIRTAIIGAFLQILSPPCYIINNLSSCGDSSEPLFGIIVLFLFYKAAFSSGKDVAWFVLLGVSSGLSIYMGYINGVLVLAYVVYFVFYNRPLLKKRSMPLLFAFIIGFSPWIYFNVLHGFCGVPPLLYSFAHPKEGIHKGYIFLSNLGDLSPSIFPSFFGFENLPIVWADEKIFIGKKILAYIYYSIFTVVFFLTLFKDRKKLGKKSFIAFYIFMFCIFYLVTDYAFFCGGLSWERRVADESSFPLILIPYIIIVLSIALGGVNFPKRSKIKRLSINGCLIVLLMVGAAGYVHLVDFKNYKYRFIGLPFSNYDFFIKKGTYYVYYDWDKILKLLRQEEKRCFYFGMGMANYENPICLKTKTGDLASRLVIEREYSHYYWAGAWVWSYFALNRADLLRRIHETPSQEQAIGLVVEDFLKYRNKESALGLPVVNDFNFVQMRELVNFFENLDRQVGEYPWLRALVDYE